MGDRIGHAELLIGNSRIMLADENPQFDAYSAKHYQGSPISLMIYVEDVDAFTQKAVAAGATIVRPVQTQFYGDRSGILLDPHGYKWTIATHVEDVSPEEMNKRMKAGAAAPGIGLRPRLRYFPGVMRLVQRAHASVRALASAGGASGASPARMKPCPAPS